MTSSIDKNKEYVTRSGRSVRIYATDGNNSFPVHGAVKNRTGWVLQTWTLKGHNAMGGGLLDLVEKPQSVTHCIWVNIYEDRLRYHQSPEAADMLRGANCIETRKIEITAKKPKAVPTEARRDGKRPFCNWTLEYIASLLEEGRVAEGNTISVDVAEFIRAQKNTKREKPQ